MKLTDIIWPNSPLVRVLGLHGRDGEQTHFTWDDLKTYTFPEAVYGSTMLKFDIQLESDSTSRRSEFHILVERLEAEKDDVIEVIHDRDDYYVQNGETETVTISAPLVSATQYAFVRFKVEICNLNSRSMGGGVYWNPSQSRIYKARKDKIVCFIATAAYGSEMASPVQFLREFRDNIVLKSRYSRFFEKSLDVYYTFSPPIAKAMMEHKALKFVIKYVIVWPFVKLAQACAIIIDFFTKKSEP